MPAVIHFYAQDATGKQIAQASLAIDKHYPAIDVVFNVNRFNTFTDELSKQVFYFFMNTSHTGLPFTFTADYEENGDF